MFKEKLFRILFPSKANQLDIKETLIEKYAATIKAKTEIANDLHNKLTAELKKPKQSEEDTLRIALGLPPIGIDFANVDDDGKPPHPLKDLSEEDRKRALAELEVIYSNGWYQKYVAWAISYLGNHSIQRAKLEDMQNGQRGLMGLRTLTGEIQKAHIEYQATRRKATKDEEEFDPHNPMPERD